MILSFSFILLFVYSKLRGKKNSHIYSFGKIYRFPWINFLKPCYNLNKKILFSEYYSPILF